MALGVVLLLLAPVVGALPGPGGIIVAGIGLALVLRTSQWAKRRYVHFKRWQPKAGRWTDWALRRRSAKRREQLRREQAGKDVEGGENPAAVGQAPVQPAGAAPVETPPEATAGQAARDADN